MKKIIRSIILILVITVLAVVMLSGCGVFGKNKAVGIEKIEKSGSEGLVDTYTITLTNGETSTFTVTNGQGTNQLPSDTYTPEHYFRFELLDDGTYCASFRYKDSMYPTVVIPSTYNGKAVTKIEYIRRDGIDKIVIPTSVTYLGDSAAPRDGIIEYKGTKAQWGAIEKEDNWNWNAAVHCTDGDFAKGE